MDLLSAQTFRPLGQCINSYAPCVPGFDCPGTAGPPTAAAMAVDGPPPALDDSPAAPGPFSEAHLSQPKRDEATAPQSQSLKAESGGGPGREIWSGFWFCSHCSPNALIRWSLTVCHRDINRRSFCPVVGYLFGRSELFVWQCLEIIYSAGSEDYAQGHDHN